jgi:hypothetical protein
MCEDTVHGVGCGVVSVGKEMGGVGQDTRRWITLTFARILVIGGKAMSRECLHPLLVVLVPQ